MLQHVSSPQEGNPSLLAHPEALAWKKTDSMQVRIDDSCSGTQTGLMGISVFGWILETSEPVRIVQPD